MKFIVYEIKEVGFGGAVPIKEVESKEKAQRIIEVLNRRYPSLVFWYDIKES